MPTTSVRTIASIAGLALVFAIAGCSAPAPATPEPTQPNQPAASAIEGLIDFGKVTGLHVDPNPVDYATRYGMNPPAGGDHWAGWLNCGVYSEPQENERAVHALEHGAVWVTYDPALVDAAGVASLQAALPDTYIVLSPFPGLPAPVVASAWGFQVQLDGPDDPRLAAFVNAYWQSPTGPEPGAPCTGGIDGPGKVG